MGNNKQKGGDPPAIRPNVLMQLTPAQQAAAAAAAERQRRNEELRRNSVIRFKNNLINLIFEKQESPIFKHISPSPNSTPYSRQNNENSEPNYSFLRNFFNSQYGVIIDRITRGERMDIITDVELLGSDIWQDIREDEKKNKFQQIMLEIIHILGGTDFLHRPQTTGGKGVSKCKKITSKKKYTTRKSPPYSASKCARGTRKKGNDGKLYVVKSTSKGVNRWMPVVSKKVKQTKKSKKN
jgi:hypothetical protein